eukprot:480472-Hanusia_phi.AAC.2
MGAARGGLEVPDKVLDVAEPLPVVVEQLVGGLAERFCSEIEDAADQDEELVEGAREEEKRRGGERKGGGGGDGRMPEDEVRKVEEREVKWETLSRVEAGGMELQTNITCLSSSSRRMREKRVKFC